MESDKIQAAYTQISWSRNGHYKTLFVSIFVLSFALDFRGTVGGGMPQFVMMGVNSFAFFILIYQFGMRIPKRSWAAFVFWGWVLYLVLGSLGALVSDVPTDRLIRIIYPVILFLEGFLVAWWVARQGGEDVLMRIMVLSAIISFVFMIWWGFYFTGRDIESIRYEILSPLIPFLLVVAGFDLILSRRNQIVSLLLITAILNVILLSVTRGMILPIAMVSGAVILAAISNYLKGRGSIPRPFVQSIFWGVVLFISGISVVLIFAPDTLQRWVLRSVTENSDVTFWTRVAAISGQWNELSGNHLAWLFGNGFGHSYYWPDSFAPLVSPDITPEILATPKWYPGEFMWVTPIFYSGLFAGALAIIILLYGVIKSFLLMAKMIQFYTWKFPIYRSFWLALLGYLAFIGLSFTANPFIVRQAPLFMGLCMGLFLAFDGRTRYRINSIAHPESILWIASM